MKDEELEEGLALEEDSDGDDDGEGEGDAEDRGDVIEKPLDPAALKRVADQAEDDDAGEQAAQPKGGAMIPKSRFDEVNHDLKAMREQNALLTQALTQFSAAGNKTPPAEQGAGPPQAEDLDALEVKRVAALLDGDTKAAAELSRTIRTEERRLAVLEATAVLERRTEEREVKSAARELQGQYPLLDHTKDDADHEAIAEVREWRDFLVAVKGQSMQDALRAAVSKVAAARGWDRPGRGIEDDAEPKKPENNRAQEQLRRNAQASLAQPPNLKIGVGNRASRSAQEDVTAMSEDEFDKLPLAEKKRLRGD